MTERIERFINGELSFEVTDAGPVDGEIVVLLHGFPQTSSAWDAVCPLLHERGYRTLTFDQRGYAAGARPRGRFAYRMSALISDVVALVRRTGGPVHLVGHDWGAAVAWSLAGKSPELVRTLTAISCPHPRAFVRSIFSSDQALRSYYIAMFQFPWLSELFLTHQPKRARYMMRRFGMSREQARRVSTEVAAGNILGGLNWYRAIPFAGSAYRGKVKAPTTFVWSKGDVALGPRCAELCSHYVTGPYQLEVLDGTHWLPEQQPAVLSNIIANRIASA